MGPKENGTQCNARTHFNFSLLWSRYSSLHTGIVCKCLDTRRNSRRRWTSSSCRGNASTSGARTRAAGAAAGFGKHIGEQRVREESGGRPELLLDAQGRVEQWALVELRQVMLDLLLQVVICYMRVTYCTVLVLLLVLAANMQKCLKNAFFNLLHCISCCWTIL